MTKKTIYIGKKVDTIPSIRHMMGDAYVTIGLELARLKNRAQDPNGTGLTAQERKGILDLIKSLRELSNEETNQRKQDLIAQLSDEEIQELLKDIIKQNPTLLVGPTEE